MIYNLGVLLNRKLSSVATKETVQCVKNTLCKVAGPKDVKKSITVAFIGKPNAGKSTLINTMMGMHICAASMKPQTTIEYQRVFNVEGDTEIVLLDTPGVLSQRKLRKYNLPKKADVSAINPLKRINLLGVLIDASDKYSKYIIPSDVKRFISTLPSTIEMVLILNKVDLLKDKLILLKIVDKVCADLKLSEDANLSNRVFTRIFMISALNNDGVTDLVQYIRSVAHEKKNYKSSERLSSHSDLKIVEQRVRAALLEHLKHNIPYECSCHLQCMEEDANGKVNIIVDIKCTTLPVLKIVSNYFRLEKIAFECEQDLKIIFGKPVLLTLHTIVDSKKKKDKS